MLDISILTELTKIESYTDWAVRSDKIVRLFEIIRPVMKDTSNTSNYVSLYKKMERNYFSLALKMLEIKKIEFWNDAGNVMFRLSMEPRVKKHYADANKKFKKLVQDFVFVAMTL